ncbi:hypothetical protein [Brevibacterium renqingii]|uniref:hypothetical protein n=1 Tax=Brevibacterium renqingii TaxID=2776916 RepID=UPI001FE5A4CF|nr:hypothetical protein [Brevibacterium renqingii]
MLIAEVAVKSADGQHQQACADEQSREVGHEHAVDGIAMGIMHYRHAVDSE